MKVKIQQEHLQYWHGSYGTIETIVYGIMRRKRDNH
jgi:hypothetical protein